MPRAPLWTRQDYREALQKIAARGVKPSIRLMREELGGGSTVLIGQLLKEEWALKAQAADLARGISAEEIFLLLNGNKTSAGVPLPEAVWVAMGLMTDFTPPDLKRPFHAYIGQGVARLPSLVSRAMSCLATLETQPDPAGENATSKAWLMAYAIAAQRMDRAILAVLFGEQWIKYQPRVDKAEFLSLSAGRIFPAHTVLCS